MENTLKSNLDPNKWISLHYSYLYNYTKTRVKDKFMVEELIQETFLAGLKSINSFENRCSERTWLTSILKHKIIDYYRKSNTISGIIEKSQISNEDYKEIYHKELEEVLFFDEEIMYGFDYKELIKVILFNINKLPKKQAEVFTMIVIDEFETETICDKLNLTKDYVWVLMSRARKSLYQELKKITSNKL
jgi:RNA polymerase sigma factor (sigma-70 family)